MKMLKINDAVEVLDDVISGKIVAIEADLYTIETSDGLLLTFPSRELVKIPDGKTFSVNREALRNAARQELQQSKKKRNTSTKRERIPTMEIDLHIEKLIPQRSSLEKHEMLSLQLETAKRQLDFALSKHIRKIVFIHGVGEGVLKTELEFLFQRYGNLEFYDADYSKYGMGATEVRIL